MSGSGSLGSGRASRLFVFGLNSSCLLRFSIQSSFGISKAFGILSIRTNDNFLSSSLGSSLNFFVVLLDLSLLFSDNLFLKIFCNFLFSCG